MRPCDRAHRPGFEDPIAAEAQIEREQGMWVVYLDVWFADEIRRHRVGAYTDEARASVVARWTCWTARRDVRPPNGMDTRQLGDVQ